MVNERESVTAKICAFVRAWHSNRARQKIYDDYLAYDMLGKEEYDSIYELISSGLDGSQQFTREDTEQIISEYFAPIPLSRIHFNESRLAEFAKEKGRIQYVICGAGSDTFAFRNNNADIEVFDIEFAAHFLDSHFITPPDKYVFIIYLRVNSKSIVRLEFCAYTQIVKKNFVHFYIGFFILFDLLF